jgi:hypothetical protein
VVLPLSLFRVENYVCLSRGVYVTVAAWRTVVIPYVTKILIKVINK